VQAQVQPQVEEQVLLPKSEPDNDGWQIVPVRGSSPVEEKVQKQDLQTFIEDLVDDAEMFKQPIEVIKKSIETQQTKEKEMRKKKPEKQIEPPKIKFNYVYFEESLSESPATLKLDITNIMKENYGDAEVVIFNSFTPFPQLILKEKAEDSLPYHSGLETYLTFYTMNLMEDFLLKILLFRNTDDIGKDMDLLNKFIEILHVYYFNCVPKEIRMQQLVRFLQYKEEIKEIKKNKKLEKWYINKTWNMIIDWVKNLFGIIFDVLDKIPKEAQEELTLKPTQFSVQIKRIMDKIPEIPEEVTDQIRTVILHECNEVLKEVEAISFLVTFFITIFQTMAKQGPEKVVAPPIIIFSYPRVFKKDIYDKINDKLQEKGIKQVTRFFSLTTEFLSNKPNFKKLISTKFAQKNQAMLLELLLLHSQEYWRNKKDLTKFCIFIEIYLDLEKPIILNDAKILTTILEELDPMDEVNLPEIIKIQCEQAYDSAAEIRSALKPLMILPIAPFPEKSQIKVIQQKSMANLEREAKEAENALLAEEAAEKAAEAKKKGKGKGKRTRKLRKA
jgi:hypothetical protein